MKLEKLIFSQFKGEPNEWKIDPLDFAEINLIVGKNASGKTLTLNVIRTLSLLFAGETQVSYKSSDFHVFFDQNGKKLEYILVVREAKIIEEIFLVDGEMLLERKAGGIGKLWAQKENKFVDFQTPETQLACIARQDSIQHPYFQALYEWGKSINHYYFGTDLGKLGLGIMLKETPAINAKEPFHLLRIFRKGKETLGVGFIESIKTAMSKIGYNIDDVDLKPPTSIVISVEGQNAPVGLSVKETDLNVDTDQLVMSQGMFRALAIITHIVYAEMAAIPSCIIIDDIGEGLDFKRSCSLIELLIEKATNSHFQLIMSTNDRFIMNKVPLKAWTVLQRERGCVHVYNYTNSKGVFDDFAMTGLNNFDFFSMEIVKQDALAK